MSVSPHTYLHQRMQISVWADGHKCISNRKGGYDTCVTLMYK